MTSAATKPASRAAKALEWWSRARESWRRMHAFDQMSPSEVSRMAHDIGVSTRDLRKMALQPGGKAELLGRRLQALSLDPEDIKALSPLLLRDLERTCALCDEKERCASDMEVSINPPGWESYCPNSGTLRTLA